MRKGGKEKMKLNRRKERGGKIRREKVTESEWKKRNGEK